MFDPKVAKALALFSQISISMLVSIFLMGWLGLVIDRHFSTTLFPVFLILGIGGGFRSAYSLIKSMDDKKPKEKEGDETKV